MLRALGARLPRSLKRFLVTGTLTVCVDAIVYSFLLRFGVEVNIAKAAGLVSATVFAYFANRIWTFEAEAGSLASFFSFIVLYAAAVLLNVGVNRLFLFLLGNSASDYVIGWFAATIASSSWNYLGLRYFVFRQAIS